MIAVRFGWQFGGVTAFVAQASDAGGASLLPGWAEAGALGLLVVLFLTDKIVTGKKFDQAVKERDLERERTDKAEALLRDQLLPALLDATTTMKNVSTAVLPAIDRFDRAVDSMTMLLTQDRAPAPARRRRTAGDDA